MTATYNARIRADNADRSRRDKGLDPLQQQGTWQGTAPATATYDLPTINTFLHFDTSNHSPGIDISSCGHPVIQFGRRAANTPAQPSAATSVTDPYTAYAYDAQGRITGCINRARLAYIYNNYNTYSPEGTIASFTARTLNLLRRAIGATQRSRTTKHSRAIQNMQLTRQCLWSMAHMYCWNLPQRLCGVVADNLFHTNATPHTLVDLHNNPAAIPLRPGLLTAYASHALSDYEHDAAYGFTHCNPFTCSWDTSCYMVVPNNPTLACMAMQWALASASDPANADSSVTIVLFLPYYTDYLSYTTHPAACHMGTVSQLDYRTAELDTGAHPTTCRHAEDASRPANPRALDRDIDVYVIANPTGKRNLRPHIPAFWDAFRAALRNPDSTTPCHITSWLDNTSTNRPHAQAPKHYRKIERRLTDIIGGSAGLPRCTTDRTTQICTSIELLFSNLHPLATSEYDGIYTDGSKQIVTDDEGHRSVRCGAAVYQFISALNEQCTYVNPNGAGNVNTINRAELSAILCALSLHASDPVLRIYTDSRCSIHQIMRSLSHPYTIRFSKHQDQLQKIAGMLYARASKNMSTHILKIKAHAGLHGNEKADKLAVDAPNHFGDIECWKDPSSSDSLSHCFWPCTTHTTASTSVTQPLPNLTTAVKASIQTTTRYGYAPQGVYASLWHNTIKLLHPKYSHQALHPRYDASGLSYTATRLTHLARWGQLPNNKLLYRWGFSDTEQCPLCPLQDGAGHILGGCKHRRMKEMYHSKHDKAVMLIQQAIAQGTHAGSSIYMDAGKTGKLLDTVVAKRLPDWMCENADKHRPDIAVIPTIKKDESARCISLEQRANHTIHIIEVGYTNDHAHPEKQAKKTQQHEVLIQRLRSAGWQCNLHVITLGHTGTILATLPATLQSLGIDATSVKKTCLALHKHAIKSLHNTVNRRRELERELPRPKRRKRRKRNKPREPP